MHNSRSRVFKFLKLACLLLFCMLFSGCLILGGGDGGRLLLFDMTLGKTALLAVVPLAY